MDKMLLKARVCAEIDNRRDAIIALGQQIYRRPELGYKEFHTAMLVEQAFQEMALPYKTGVAITGSIAQMEGKQHKVRLAVMGELDAVACPAHPHADPQTGAAHCCGHNAQIAAMLGMAMGLHYSGIMQELDGDIQLMAVPAEEAGEVEWRQSLIEEGKIGFLGGKQEMLRLGCFDDVDLAMMMHSTADDKIHIGGTSNGFIAKYIQYIGREAHAGAPHLGINALNAAQLGLASINANRETFREEDCIRVHPIITKGGTLVNIIPADVRMETYVRGRTMECIMDASQKVNRALRAGADAVGAQIKIQEIPGYLPRYNNPAMGELFAANARQLLGQDCIIHNGHSGGSSDFGDVSGMIPAIHPYVGGACGHAHNSDYQITDPELFYVTAAKLLAMTAIDLLCDGARAAQEICHDFTPLYKTKEEYLTMWNNICGR